MNYYSYSSFKKVIDELRKKIIGCRINNITVINSHDFLCTLSMIKDEKLLISLNHQHPFLALINVKKVEPTIMGNLNESLRKFLKDAYIVDINLNNDDRINSKTAVDKNNLTLHLDNKIIKLNENQIYQIAIEIIPLTISELNDLYYKEALKKDKRTFCLYYLSLIKKNHIIYFSFVPYLDYNSRILKIYLFFFNFCINFTTNALFFNDKTMHKIYEEGGSFNFIYNIPQIIYSALITGVIDYLIKLLALTESNFIQLKKYKHKDQNDLNIEAQRIWNIIKIKFGFFFFFNLCFLILFWFYLACFCAVYKNTQIHLIKDTVISFCTSMIYPLFIYIIPSILRIKALNDKRRECMFKLSKIWQIL